jgi:hypothetical protein
VLMIDANIVVVAKAGRRSPTPVYAARFDGPSDCRRKE